MSLRTTIVLAVLLFACLAVAIFVGTPATPLAPLPPLFLEFARADVRTVDLRNPGGEIHLERDAKDRERWRVKTGGNLVRAASEKVEEFLNDLATMSPKQLFKAADVKPEERKKWGIESPGMTVRLGLEGREIRAAFGTETLEKQNTFAEKEPGADVYVVPAATVATLKGMTADLLRERRPVGFSTYEAKELGIRRADGTILEAQKASGGTWEVTVPYKGSADPVRLEEVLSRALTVEVVDFAADGAPDLARFGLDEPRAKITVRREGRDAPLVLTLGKDAPDGTVYFMEEGEPSVYTCSKGLPDAVAKLDPAAIRDRNLLRIGWARIDSIEFTHPESPWKLLRVLERWDVEKPERVPAEVSQVDALLADLRELEVLKFLDGEDPEKHGLKDLATAPARLVLAGTDDSGNRTLLLGKKDAEGNVPVRLLPPKDSKDAPPVVVVPGSFLDRLLEGWLSFRSLDVLKVDLAEVRGISRKTAEGEETFLRDKGAWKAAPGGKEPDGETLTHVLSHLLTLKCSGFEAKAKEGLEKWGLGEPPAGPVVTLRLGKEGEKEERTRTLVLGGAPEGGASHYARMADGDLVFRLPDNLVRGADVIHFHEAMTRPWDKRPKAPETPPPPPEEPKKEDAPRDGKPAEPAGPKEPETPK